MIVLDTHCLVWYMKGDQRLGKNALARIETQRSSDEGAIAIAAITLWEISMLVSKGRLSVGQDLGTWFAGLSREFLRILPLDAPVAVDNVSLAGWFHGDPSDRLIVATARHHSRPLLTADKAILAFAREGHLQAEDATL